MDNQLLFCCSAKKSYNLMCYFYKISSFLLNSFPLSGNYKPRRITRTKIFDTQELRYRRFPSATFFLNFFAIFENIFLLRPTINKRFHSKRPYPFVSSFLNNAYIFNKTSHKLFFNIYIQQILVAFTSNTSPSFPLHVLHQSTYA